MNVALILIVLLAPPPTTTTGIIIMKVGERWCRIRRRGQERLGSVANDDDNICGDGDGDDFGNDDAANTTTTSTDKS